MRRKLTTVAVAGALGVAGLTGVSASAAAEDGSTTPVERIGEALRSLVDDGTLDEEQAEAVAEALAARPELLRPDRALRGGPGGLSLDVAGEVLDMSREEMRAALRSGSTLAALAEERGVDVGTLVDALVQAARHRLDDAVTSGRMTPERAEAMVDGLEEHVRRHVEAGPAGRDGVRGGPSGPLRSMVGTGPSRGA